MSVVQKLASVFVSVASILAASLGASAATPPKADEHVAHHPATAASAPKPAAGDRVKAMREMRDKMTSAKTPAERQALMADHMKVMQEGMQSMKDMSGMAGMEGRMDMMQTMMEMMMQRMPATEADRK